ncbi:hypothetical protein MB02_08360 [Croceicoccus estronivorus]|uniref:hypothetical protein n=1 Tax=Croceicoccus estronivorus TaxID=1172626 RepID=UPI00082A6869|nr:hypothetical protein [Croceicoccus estronivorus]OCC23837.1 hypothetical protein MB02_08360 [Croceicoccus estronivorus]
MGKVTRFDPHHRRGRRQGRRVAGYRKQAPRSSRNRRRTWGRALSGARPFLLLVGLIAVAVVLRDGAAFEPPAYLQTEPEWVDGQFTRCGPGRGHYCVFDGDTFKLGDRKIRVVGIDTAEVRARCPAEAAQAEASTAALQHWLNRGPFAMTARIDDPTDRYGRNLRIMKRKAPDGTEDRLADFMRNEGGARRYLGGYRGGWC